MNINTLIEVIRREAEACRVSFTHPNQSPEYRAPFHACHIMLEDLAAKLNVAASEPDQAILDKAGARRIELKSSPELAPTLRDQFAMAAMPAIVRGSDPKDSLASLVEIAYVLADAMMERRKR